MKRAVKKVLIVEDEPIPAAYLQKIIEEDETFEVVAILQSAEEVRDFLSTTSVDILFMDIMISGMVSGAELALEVYQEYKEILIIFMTAYSDEEMINYAVEAKAFGYLLKPYRPNEIKAILQLAKAKEPIDESVQKPAKRIELIDGYFYEMEKERLCRGKEEIPLSSAELSIIRLLCENHHIVVEKQAILDQLGISELSLRSMIYRIRKQTSKALIQSVKRFGYRIATV
jgi:DNA-binding response OmpR family regulator